MTPNSTSYLHAIDKKTGKVSWIEEAETYVHNTPMAGQLAYGRWAIVHGRGGGHAPLKEPYGVSLTLPDSGKMLWIGEIKGDSSYNSHWNAKNVFWFQWPNHLVLDSATGEILRTQNIIENERTIPRTNRADSPTDFHSLKAAAL